MALMYPSIWNHWRPINLLRLDFGTSLEMSQRPYLGTGQQSWLLLQVGLVPPGEMRVVPVGCL